jgi:hypothetical protein
MIPPQVVQDLNSLLKSYDSQYSYEELDPIFDLQGILTDANSPSRAISRLLTGLLSAPIHSGIFYHYTRGQAAKTICTSQILRLTSISKRISEGEIEDFLKRFGFNFPLQIDPQSGKPNYYTSLARRIFYTSFTDIDIPKETDGRLWDDFSREDGARLKFRINLRSGHLRQISYGSDSDRALVAFKQVHSIIAKHGYKAFAWDDAGIACALHLPSKFQSEKETRLIAYENCGLMLGHDSSFDYLEMPFGENRSIPLNIELLEIQTNRSDLNSFGFPIIPR